MRQTTEDLLSCFFGAQEAGYIRQHRVCHYYALLVKLLLRKPSQKMAEELCLDKTMHLQSQHDKSEPD